MAKLYYYKTGIWGYERCWVFAHRNKYSTKEFRTFIHEAALHVLNNFEEYEGEHTGRIVYVNRNGKRPYGVYYENIEQEVMDILMKKHGFKIVEFQAQWWAWETTDMFDKEDNRQKTDVSGETDIELLQDYLVKKKCKICSIQKMTEEEKCIQYAENAEKKGDVKESQKWRKLAKNYRTEKREATRRRKTQ